MLDKIKQTAEWIQSKLTNQPVAAIILGSGLGQLGQEIQAEQNIPYNEIPNFPISTVKGHEGKLIVGKLAGKNILAMNGRFHYYEGYSMKEVTFPIRVFHALGIQNLFVSNAAGGTNPGFHIGDIMLITDQINLLPENPLRGHNIEPGPRFLDMSHAYSPTFIQRAIKIAANKDIKLQKGVYIALQGPTYETPAEYNMCKLLGADAVGMSTVPEIIVANHCGMNCMGISVITNIGLRGAKVSHDEVTEQAHQAGKKMTEIFRSIIETL